MVTFGLTGGLEDLYELVSNINETLCGDASGKCSLIAASTAGIGKITGSSISLMACSLQWPGWESACLPQFACKYPRTSGSALLPPSSDSNLFSGTIWTDILKPEMEKLFVQLDAGGNFALTLPFKLHPPRLSSQQVDAVVRPLLCDSYVIRKFQKVPKIKTGSVMRLKIIFNLKLKVLPKRKKTNPSV